MDVKTGSMRTTAETAVTYWRQLTAWAAAHAGGVATALGRTTRASAQAERALGSKPGHRLDMRPRVGTMVWTGSNPRRARYRTRRRISIRTFLGVSALSGVVGGQRHDLPIR